MVTIDIEFSDVTPPYLLIASRGHLSDLLLLLFIYYTKKAAHSIYTI